VCPFLVGDLVNQVVSWVRELRTYVGALLPFCSEDDRFMRVCA
jgi:hypothetical protein